VLLLDIVLLSVLIYAKVAGGGIYYKENVY